jgi:hypothetical protein
MAVGLSLQNVNAGNGPQAPVASPSKTHQQRSEASFGNLALSFEDNRNQSRHEFDFLARGSGTTFLLNYSGADIILQRDKQNSVHRPAAQFLPNRHRARTGPATLQVRLVGANARSRGEKEQLLPGKSNYLIGNDPRSWRTNIPNYGKVSYTNIYPGIDVTYYGNRRQLEYDFTVKPGANPTAIAINFVDADKVEIDGSGNLKVRIGGGEIVQRKPFIYQEIGGVGRGVTGRYVRRAPHEIRFEIGNYDASAPLIIDPVLVYSTYLGGGSSDQGISVALDSSGKAYIAGVTTSADFPVTSGAAQSARGAGNDIFITKLNAAGTAMVYSTYIGGSGSDEGLGLAVDLGDSAYLTGITDSTDFPTTTGSAQTTRGGGTDAFVVKLNSTGTGLSYGTYLGGSLDEEGYGVAVDLGGNAYVTGVTDSGDFPTHSAFQTAKRTGSDAFITKISPNGTSLPYSTFLGGDGVDWAFGVATDGAGNAYVTGATSSSNFPITSGSLQSALRGPADGFVAKINTSDAGLNSLTYATYLGGSGFDMCGAIALDEAGNAYVTGLTDSTNFPITPSAPQTVSGGGSDAFISKVSAAGSTLLYSTYLGGGGPDWGRGITVDTTGQAHVTGSTESVNFPISANPLQAASAGKSDAFATKLDAAGTSFIHSSYSGGAGSEDGMGLATDLAGNAFVVGTTFSTNLPVTQGALQTVAHGNGDAFVAKISNPNAGQVNQVDAALFFVKQHYLDFLNRQADSSGLAFWTDQITSCGSDQQCLELRRINVSAAFFLSIEFQQTGYLVYRFTKASYNAMPRYELFLPDTQQIGRGVVVQAPGWEELLEANKRAFADAWVKRLEFRAIYDSKSNPDYVDALFANAGVTPTTTERAALIDGLNGGTQTRASVLRTVAENEILKQQESNRAFVLVQYFGYLRRNPDDLPDGNLDGFNFWLGKLNQFNGNFVNAEMVKAFIVSGEYRGRFGP